MLSNDTDVFLRVYYLVPRDEVLDFPQLSTDLDAATDEKGNRELIATNKMGIIDAQLIKGKATVKRVSSEKCDEIPQAGYWWQYKWDIMKKVRS